ncbi:MAG: 1-acyl-sn-glycerol-3-phosphate acyltransferase [Actinobacteria bacterium]|nr:1-acyl-sn-glycerol-3-phosphate acyltransferase [Actinomycetota bacterium]
MNTIKNFFGKLSDFFYSIPRFLFINFYKSITRIRVFNQKGIPKNGSAIFAINHVTGADPIIILAALKKKIYFLADSENFRTRFTDFFMRKFANSIPVFKTRFINNVKSFKELFRLTFDKSTKNIFLGIFPEGDLIKKDEFGKFHKGAAYLSYKTKLPIIPVYIHNLLKGPGEEKWIGRNRVTEGIIALIINSFRKIGVFIGKPIYPLAENIISDFKTLTDKNKYKRIVENINKALEKQFIELKKQAEEVFSGLKAEPITDSYDENKLVNQPEEEMTDNLVEDEFCTYEEAL